MNFSFADYSVVAIYFLLLLILGIRASVKKQSQDDFLLAGRKVTLPGFVVTLVATWYGGILGVGEYSYTYGISNWLAFGFPYYVFAFIFAIWLAPRIRKSNLISIPDQIEASYGRRAGLLSALFTFLMVSPAPYVLMSGILIALILPVPIWISMIIALFFSLIYVGIGGYKTLIVTDFLQFALMFGGFFIILPVAWFTFGGFEFLQLNLPPAHLEWIPAGTGSGLVVWFFIASMTLADPGFYQRCYSAKSPQVARRGILISIGFWLIFDICTTLTGLYARAALPDLAKASLSYPALADQILPSAAKGLFFTGMLATVLSTLNGFSFLAAQSLGKDFWMRWKGTPEAESVKVTRISLLIVAAVSFGIAAYSEMIVNIWYTLGSVVLPALLLPLLLVYIKPDWVRNLPMAGMMLATFLVSSGWWISGLLFPEVFQSLFLLSPFYPGVLVMGGMLVGFLFKSR